MRLLLLSALLLAAVPAQACDCQRKADMSENADYIFEATVKAIHADPKWTLKYDDVEDGKPSTTYWTNPPVMLALEDKKTVKLSEKALEAKGFALEKLRSRAEMMTTIFTGLHDDDCAHFAVAGHRYRFYSQLKDYTVSEQDEGGQKLAEHKEQDFFAGQCLAEDITPPEKDDLKKVQ